MKEEILNKIISLGQTRDFKEGDVIFEEGSLSQEFCYVLSGKACVEKNISPSKTVRIVTITEKEFFGEMVLFQEGKRLAYVVALTQAKIVFIKRETLFGFLEKAPQDGLEMFLFIVRKMLQRMGHTNRQMSCFYQLSGALARASDAKEFLQTIAQIIAETFSFPACAGYFYNEITGQNEVVYLKEVSADAQACAQGKTTIEVAMRQSFGQYGITQCPAGEHLLFLPVEGQKRIAGAIIFIKQEPFSDNEQGFMGVISALLNSFLADLLNKQDAEGRQRLKNRSIQF